MKFWITVNYKVNSVKTINKELFFEYYKSEDKNYCDHVKITNDQIVIFGERNKDFKLRMCFNSKKSNYKRCLVSSLFYLYNYFGEKIEIESIEAKGKKKDGSISSWDNYSFNQEFNLNSISPNLRIDCKLIECLFQKNKYPSIYKMLYNVLISQAHYVRNSDFYYAYRAFNAVYTFIYSYDEEFEIMENRNKNADSDAIKHILKSEKFKNTLNESIKISENYLNKSQIEIFKSNLSRLTKNEDKFLKEVGFIDYEYEDSRLLDFIKDLFKDKFNLSIDEHIEKLKNDYQQAIDEYNDKNQKDPIAYADDLKKLKAEKQRLKTQIETFENFKAKVDMRGNTQPINILQFFIVYSMYKRNKILHGEQFDSLFFIHDTNVDEINELSKVVFQTCVELLNNLDLKEYIDK